MAGTGRGGRWPWRVLAVAGAGRGGRWPCQMAGRALATAGRWLLAVAGAGRGAGRGGRCDDSVKVLLPRLLPLPLEMHVLLTCPFLGRRRPRTSPGEGGCSSSSRRDGGRGGGTSPRTRPPRGGGEDRGGGAAATQSAGPPRGDVVSAHEAARTVAGDEGFPDAAVGGEGTRGPPPPLASAWVMGESAAVGGRGSGGRSRGRGHATAEATRTTVSVVHRHGQDHGGKRERGPSFPTQLRDGRRGHRLGRKIRADGCGG